MGQAEAQRRLRFSDSERTTVGPASGCNLVCGPRGGPRLLANDRGRCVLLRRRSLQAATAVAR